jgi:hypothetical protein
MGTFIFIVVMTGLGIMLMKLKAEKDAEKNQELRKSYISNPEKNENPILKKNNFESKALAIAITIFVLMTLIAMLVMTYNKRNPIIGKWKSETTMPFMGKMINEVEFTNNSVYMSGMKFNADYEIDEKRIILNDDSGIGLVYEIIDDRTMRTNAMGFETIYRKID